MTLTVKSAADAFRRVHGSSHLTRKRLSHASREEEAGTAGAAEERQRISAQFARDLDDAARLLSDTELAERDFRLAASILRDRVRSIDTPQPLSAVAVRLVRLGPPSAALDDLATRCEAAAQAAGAAAERTKAAQDGYAYNLDVTASLIALSATLAARGFNPDHHAVKTQRGEYQAAAKRLRDHRRKTEK